MKLALFNLFIYLQISTAVEHIMFVSDADFHMAALKTILGNSAAKTTVLERKLAETQEALAEAQQESSQLKNRLHLSNQLLKKENSKLESVQKKNDSLALDKEQLADSTSRLSFKLVMLQNKLDLKSKG